MKWNSLSINQADAFHGQFQRAGLSLCQFHGGAGGSDHQHAVVFAEDFIVNVDAHDGIGADTGRILHLTGIPKLHRNFLRICPVHPGRDMQDTAVL